MTGGTYLNGVIHIGEEQWSGGRADEPATHELAAAIKDLGLVMGRMKTGTPARLLRSSVDISKMSIDETEPLEYLFEYEPHTATTKENCYITHTNEQTHEIIRASAERSPIFSKRITGTPTRYCPSIEDKITRFADKTSHHVFVEPEGYASDELYPNGISNSLPRDVQEAMIASIPGFEHAKITKYAYGIEYDFVQPNQLDATLEVRSYPGLFFAGQINGTTGYEEAAGQGLIAGINAAHKALGRPPYVMHRTDGYIGVMIDDLTHFGVDEPYRMFTSRAERRLSLRQDNVFIRLAPHAYALGTISEQRRNEIMHGKEQVTQLLQKTLTQTQIKGYAQELAQAKQDDVKLALKAHAHAVGIHLSPRGYDYLFAELLYAPYHERELREIQKSITYRELRIPPNFCYQDLPGLSRELQEKLQKHAPKTVEDAQKIPGITPATISLLIFKLRMAERS
ncbi:TPA: tRNA uridine-5-carboxymethylaminomethyl(34) synthesis enzyme MnmG [Candidatus Dependentiae bacterium]|nr:tRNA uridine-5-carboxymethylaminomethyl(34) synthesis enzyme MnmG [Candidatus Dependentiae bacterium]